MRIEMEMVDKLPEKIKALTAGKPYTSDRTGMSGSAVILYEDMVLKIEKQSEACDRMLRIMKWLEGKLPVPRIICQENTDGLSFLLMSRIRGRMSCDRYYMEHPDELVSLLAQGLKMLWSVDISGCPNVRTLDAELCEARYRVENGLVDRGHVQPDTFGENGFESPQKLLEWLDKNRPGNEPVLSHGDFCLPNVFVDNGRISGFIDLGDTGIGDKWRDIALCCRSLKNNFAGVFGGKVYPDFRPELLFEKLEIEPDWEKLRYYILLDELF